MHPDLKSRLYLSIRRLGARASDLSWLNYVSFFVSRDIPFDSLE